MDNFSDRLREERERLKLSQTAFADIAGASKPSQVRYENGERRPDSLYLAALAQAGVDITYVLTGYRVPAIIKEIKNTLGPSLAKADDLATQFLDHRPISASDYASIPLHEAWLSAGPGVENADSNIVDHLAFRRDWLKRIGITASQSCLARVMGDSMFPTLSPGDMVLLDTSKTAPPVRQRSSTDRRRTAIWAIVENGEARIKRVERPSDTTMLLISDNTDYPPELISGDQLAVVQIIGKVVWWGHTSKD